MELFWIEKGCVIMQNYMTIDHNFELFLTMFSHEYLVKVQPSTSENSMAIYVIL